MSDFKPTWRYGPNGQSMICYSESEIPKGWQDHPSKVKEEPATKGKGKPEALDL